MKNPQLEKHRSIISSAYPELNAGGFTHVDGTIQFYLRVNALLSKHFRVLDVGAGRGAWSDLIHRSSFKYQVRRLKGKVANVTGIDVDEAVLSNEELDSAFVVDVGRSWPLEDEAFDLIISDYTLEHVQDPEAFVNEVSRVLKPGGWFCARTPNKWCYIAMFSRLFLNRLH